MLMHSLIQITGMTHLHPTLALGMFQSSGQAFFQSIWSTNFSAVSGWFGSSGAITVAADGILSVLLILGVYEAFGRGGNLSDLMVLMMKVAMCAFLIQNWNSFFTDITTNGAFQLANSIANQDFYSNLWSNYSTLFKNNFSSLNPWDMFTDIALLAQAVAVLITTVVYWVAYYLLSFLFTVWGLALYALGPLMVAFIPSSFAGTFGLGYIKGLLQWLSWPILYAIMGQIVSGLAGQTGWDYTSGVNMLTTSAIIIVFAVALIFIPWIANQVIAGDFARSIGGPVLNQITSTIGQLSSGAAQIATAGVGGAAGGAGGAGAAGAGGAGAAASSPAVTPPPATPPIV